MKTLLFSLTGIFMTCSVMAEEVPAYLCQSDSRAGDSTFEVVMYQQPRGVSTTITVRKTGSDLLLKLNAAMEGSRYVGDNVQFEAKSIRSDCERACEEAPDLTGNLTVRTLDQNLNLNISCESTMVEKL